MVRNTSEHNLINIYQNTIEYEYINRFPKLRIRNIIKKLGLELKEFSNSSNLKRGLDE